MDLNTSKSFSGRRSGASGVRSFKLCMMVLSLIEYVFDFVILI